MAAAMRANRHHTRGDAPVTRRPATGTAHCRSVRGRRASGADGISLASDLVEACRVTQIARVARQHWPAAVLAVVAAGLLFTALGADYLWEDEGDTAVLARTILQHGVPKAWDGVTFSDADYGQRLTSSLTMISHP